MSGIDVLAVVGTCGSERTRYAALLAAVADRSLFPASRLDLSPSPLGETLALVPWTDRPAGAIVELPGTVHPAAMIRALTSEHSGVRLTGIVCVVDAVHLLDDLRSDGYATRPMLGASTGQRMTSYMAHSMLTVTQLERASMIVLVNWHALATPDLSTVMALVSALNPHARLRLEHGATQTPETGSRYVSREERPGCAAILQGTHSPHMTDPRVGALRYEHARPLHPARLRSLLDERIERGEFGTVLRSSGLCRLATRPGITTEWSHVGRMFSLEPMGSDEQIARFGDSLTLGQDLAFIGLDLDTAGLAGALDETALTDEEFEAGAAEWSRYPDPFPVWQEIAGGSD